MNIPMKQFLKQISKNSVNTQIETLSGNVVFKKKSHDFATYKHTKMKKEKRKNAFHVSVNSIVNSLQIIFTIRLQNQIEKRYKFTISVNGRFHVSTMAKKANMMDIYLK